MIFYQRYDDPSKREDGLEGRVASNQREKRQSQISAYVKFHMLRVVIMSRPSRDKTTILWWNSDARVFD